MIFVKALEQISKNSRQGFKPDFRENSPGSDSENTSIHQGSEDVSKKLASVRLIKAIQPNGASSTTNFDAAGQVSTETDALNRTTRYSFDSGGRKTVTTDALGNVWQNFYDTAGRLISTQDPLGATVSMTYDLMDRVITQSDPLGNVNSFEFDAAGRRVAKTDAMGRRSITTFDLRDRVTSEVDPEGHVVSFGYNLAGQRVSLTDGANRVWRWALDGLGRVISETDPLGNVNHYGLDCVGNRTSWINARGQITSYAFNEMNRVVQITSPDNSLASISYDLEGRELSRSGPAGTVVKTYDSVGNMTSETFGPWGKEWQYGFDLVGNRVSATDPEGGVFLYAFDKMNRLVQLDPPERGDEVKYTFDAAGRPITEARSVVKTVNTFDAAGRLLELKHERGSGTVVALCRYTYSPVGNRLTMTDENGGVTRYSYNGSDWLTKAIYPDGQQVSYSYNGAGDRLTETTETPTVKGHGRHKVIGTDTVVIPLAYDAGGRLISKASDTFDFDSDGNQVAAVENGDETRFMWSADNRLTNVEKDLPCAKHGNKKCGHCPPVITAEEYSYLPQDWRRVTRSVFTHDGQRCKHGYGYGHGRGHVCDEIPGHGKGHDRDGQNDEAVYVSVYDNQDESHEYLLKAGVRDAHNQRHELHKCTADQQKPNLELVRAFIGGPGTDDLEYTRQDQRSLTMLKDALGSTIALTVSDGRPLARIGYDVWGNLRWPDKPGHSLKPCDDKDVPDWLDRFENGRSFGQGIDPWHFGRHHGKAITPYLYTGRRLDSFSNNYFNRNRYYSPKVGRFITKDPIGFDGGNNLWAYANQNPVLYSDPDGLTVPEALLLMGNYRLLSSYRALITGAYQNKQWGKIKSAAEDVLGVMVYPTEDMFEIYGKIMSDPDLLVGIRLMPLPPGYVKDQGTFVSWVKRWNDYYKYSLSRVPNRTHPRMLLPEASRNTIFDLARKYCLGTRDDTAQHDWPAHVDIIEDPQDEYSDTVAHIPVE